MIFIALQIHRNILSVQGYIRYLDFLNCVNKIEVECFSSELQLSFLLEDTIVKKVKIITPNDFFIPSSLFSDSDSSVKTGSKIICRTTLRAAGPSEAECSFRLQVSGVDHFNLSESELKVDVKDFFKDRFKNGGRWDLFCAMCGDALPLDPVIIENVKEYSESELSEGWFCHGNGPHPALQPSTRTLYMDDTSFYLYPRTDVDNSHKITTDLNTESCSSHDTAVENQTNLDVQVLGDSVLQNNNSSCLKQDKSSVGSGALRAFGDFKHSSVDKNDSKALNLVECQSCRNVLTSEKSSVPFIRFYIDKIMFKNPSSNDDYMKYGRKITLLSLWSLVTRSQTSQLPSKLFLQSKMLDKELCLLLWIPSAPIAQFMLQDSLRNIPVEINLETKPVYKVLYLLDTSHSEIVRSWRHDFNVDFYHVSDTMVMTLAEILRSSSNLLNETSSADGFSCGSLSAPSQLETVTRQI